MVNGYAVHCNDIFYYLSIYSVVSRVCAWFRMLEVSFLVCGSPALWFVDGAMQNYGKRSHCLWALLPCVVKPGVCMVSRKWDLFHGCGSGGYQNQKSCVLGKPDRYFRYFFSSCTARKVCDGCFIYFFFSGVVSSSDSLFLSQSFCWAPLVTWSNKQFLQEGKSHSPSWSCHSLPLHQISCLPS